MRRVEDEVRSFIQRTFRAQVALVALRDDTSLFSSGIIDSFGVLELIAFLEDAFQIEIDTTQRNLSEFDTVAKIAALVGMLRREARDQ